MSATYDCTAEDIGNAANLVKDCVAEAMAREGFITPERASEFCQNYAVIIHPRGILGRTIDALLGLDAPMKIRATVVRIVNKPEAKGVS